MDRNLQVRLRRRPVGWPAEDDFEIAETDVPRPRPGQALVRNQWLSLDPYMRGRMNEGPSYAPRVELGDVMVGGTVGEVVESSAPGLAPGDAVVGFLGWQRYGVGDARSLRRVDRTLPLSVHLGAAGMPGVTAWIGLSDIGQPKNGETLVVSGAAGAVGSVAGQLGRLAGCRVIGVAGGPAKCEHVVKDLGFDACVDYKAGRLREDLAAAAPDGIDVYFDNVGGEVLEAVLRRVRPFARIPLCGLVSQYNETRPHGLSTLFPLLVNRVRLQGFIVSDHLERWPAAQDELARRVADGTLRYRETVAHGLENAPRAFLGMLRGENLGKQLVAL